ncbi:PRTG family protein [Megaselia abdita]
MKESRKFTVFTTLLRVYTNTFEVFHEKGRNSEVMSSFFSEPLHCTTQGLPISLWKDRFMIHWNPDKIPNIESFVVQMLLPFSRGKSFQGITNSSEDVQEIFEKKDEELFKNLASKNILSLVFPPNVRGIAFPEMKKLNVRLLAITDENKKLMTTENLEQLSWTLVRRKYLYVVSVEPKSVVFRSMKDLEMNFYLKICHKKVMADEIHCETNLIKNGEPLVYDNLATKTLHKFIFYNSSTDQELDEIQIKTGVESKCFPKRLRFFISFSVSRAWSC